MMANSEQVPTWANDLSIENTCIFILIILPTFLKRIATFGNGPTTYTSQYEMTAAAWSSSADERGCTARETELHSSESAAEVLHILDDHDQARLHRY